MNWTKHTVYFTPTTDSAHVVFACPGTSQNTLIDTVSVTEVAVSAAGDVGVNGDMEVTGTYKVGDVQVVGPLGAAIADATGGATVDVEARATLNTLLARLRAHGLIES